MTQPRNPATATANRRPPTGQPSAVSGQKAFARQAIFEQCPWLAPNDDPALLVIGDDLDAVLSAALFLYTHPRARLAGLYHQYTRVLHAAAFAWKEVLNALWLDLDIYHPQCRSLGHHIVRLSRADALPGFAGSCNLNELAGVSQEAFRQKYPLGTIHFLMWLYEVEIPARQHAESLIWLADSAYINGQTRVYRKGQASPGFRWNVERWLKGALPLPSLLKSFESLDTPEFEQRMAELQQRMAQRGFVQGSGQVASQHLQLTGYQCQPQGPIGAYIRNLLAFIAQITGWSARPEQIALLGDGFHVYEGRRAKADLQTVRREGLAAFLEREKIFSYVFDFGDRINYTTL